MVNRMAFSGFGTSTFGAPPSTNPFGQAQPQQQQPQQSAFGKPFGQTTSSAWGQPQTTNTGVGAGSTSLFGGGTQAAQPQQQTGLFGGGAFGSTSQPQMQQQQQQQQEQRRFWENEIDLLRDSYTPGGGQRTTNYKFALRVDDPTGVPREANPADHKTINDKLTSQQAEMNQIQSHMGSLGSMVTNLLGASVEAKRRLEACREKNMSLMHRFLVLLQRIQVVHNLNRPFEARDKELKDRLEHMAARLEDAVRALNDVAAAVEEEEADVGEVRREITCELSPLDLQLLQRTLEKQQSGLDEMTRLLRRDMQGVKLLKDKLDSRQVTL